MIVAHRGFTDRGKVKENSFKSIENAMKLNLPVEIDISLDETDGKLKLSHYQDLIPKEAPLFEEILINPKFESVEFFLDLKVNHDSIDIYQREFIRIVNKCKRKHNELWIFSFNHELIRRFSSTDMKKYHLGLLFHAQIENLPLYLKKFPFVDFVSLSVYQAQHHDDIGIDIFYYTCNSVKSWNKAIKYKGHIITDDPFLATKVKFPVNYVGYGKE